MKIGIVTIIGNNNYGNRLQNYALQEVLKKQGYDVETVLNEPVFNFKHKYWLRKIKYFNVKKLDTYDTNVERAEAFARFNKRIKFSNKLYTIKSKFDYDCLVVGSDQIWNPWFDRLSDFDLLNIKDSVTKIAYSASFGVDCLPVSVNTEKVTSCLKNFKAISVRENEGKEIINKLLPDKEIQVLIDPTMMLDSKEWDFVLEKPKQFKQGRFILNYFLGNLSNDKKEEIQKIASKYKCTVINILDKNDPYFSCGPSEFLYLEKHAFLICTDSFHSSVFAILYNRPFVIFDRDEYGVVNMNSRLNTLLSKLKIEDRRYNGEYITEENLNHNYSKAYEILEKERNKSINFLNQISK